MEPVWVYFLVGAAACFCGTIPFGPINLAVVKATVDHDRGRGAELALAASIVEIGEAIIAICFGLVISSFLQMNPWLRLAIALGFFALAGILLARKPRTELSQTPPSQGSYFRRGLLIAALNPQAVPFWILALAVISQYFAFNYQGFLLAAFLAGVFLGKLAALSGFIALASYLKSRLQSAAKLVNQALALVLVLIGLSQLSEFLL